MVRHYFRSDGGDSINKMDIKEKDYKQIPGWWSDGDAEVYNQLINSIPDYGSIVEIGCYCGRSICSIANLIKIKRLLVTSVDLFCPNSIYISGEFAKVDANNMLDIFKSNINQFDIKSNIIKADSVTASKMCQHQLFDLIMIDADHNYNSVIQDIESWVPLLNKNGIICGHDADQAAVKAAIHKKFNDITVGNNSKIWFTRPYPIIRHNDSD